MSTRLPGLPTFSMASAIWRMTRGAALTAAAPSAVEVARPMLSRALVRPAQTWILKCQYVLIFFNMAHCVLGC